MTSIDVLAAKIDDMSVLQKEHREDMKQLTSAVTTLVTQTQHFEKMRQEDHKRMDHIQSCHDELDKIVSKLAQQISEIKPMNEIWKYVIMIIISTSIGAVGAIIGNIT
jgi:peptidoglycan hydrolase CwlO-like protein